MKYKTHLIGSFPGVAALFAASAVIAYSQTITINPVEPIPATHTLVFQSEWNTEGDKQGW